MRIWKNPFICVPWRAFWLMVQHLSELVQAEKEVRDALNGGKKSYGSKMDFVD